MTPRMEACYFNTGNDQWEKLARVLEHSAAAYCPRWSVTIACIQPVPLVSAIHKAAHVSNAQKTAYWCERVQQAPDGTPMLLIDVAAALG
jgi:hypothetical protein